MSCNIKIDNGYKISLKCFILENRSRNSIKQSAPNKHPLRISALVKLLKFNKRPALFKPIDPEKLTWLRKDMKKQTIHSQKQVIKVTPQAGRFYYFFY